MESAGRKGQQARLLEGLYKFYQEGQLTDVTLVVEGKEFPCNRNVLAANSPYFRAMFMSNVKESTDNEIELQGLNNDAMAIILNYMYCGKLSLTNTDVQNVFTAANFLEMLEIVDQCADHISSAITVNNCLEIFFFAVYNYCEKLKSTCHNFILRNFIELSEREEFISKIESDDLHSLISDDDIYVEKEEYLFEYLIKWIKHDYNGRKSSFPKLFQCIRLPLLPDSYFMDVVSENELVKSNPFCQGLLTSYKLFKIQQSNMLDEDLETSPFANPKPRLGMFTRKLIIYSGGSFSESDRSFTAFDPVSKKNYYGIKPHPSFDFKFRIDHFILVTTNEDKIFFLGGIFYENYHFAETGDALRDVLLYDEKNAKWIKQKPMVFPRCHFAACSYGNEIFVCGGKSRYPIGDAVDSVEVFDPEISVWTVMAPMPVCLSQHAVCCYKKSLFVFGGKDIMEEYVDSIFHYDILMNTWSIVRSRMMKPRSEHLALGINDKIYIIGGGSKYSNAVEVEIYDPSTNRWSFGSDFVEERKVLAGCVYDGHIYITGGIRVMGRPNKPTRTVETKDFYRYDVHSNQWQKLIRFVQYANTQCCTVATLNTKFLQESDFISVGDGVPTDTPDGGHQ